MKNKITENNTMSFRVDTLGLLNEIVDGGLRPNMGVLKIPINIFKDLLADVAYRATELNDPKLNILMLSLCLYEVSPNDIPKAINLQKRIINQKAYKNENKEFRKQPNNRLDY